MPKYWGKQIFAHGDSPKWVKSRRWRRKKEKNKRERAKVGNNNGQLRIATPPRVAHAKLSGPKLGIALSLPVSVDGICGY